MTGVRLEGCSCVCENVSNIFTTTETIMAKVSPTPVDIIQIILVVIIVLLIILGLIIGYKKISSSEEEGHERYY